jgi:tRNA G10  N-methylase Trm11
VGNEKVLARRIAVGPRTSIIAPATRICITNTPLEPIASFSLCNVARIRNGMAILDPYAGSCATLLAASMITPQSRTVGIEIAHNGLVNRVDVRKDFSSRNLTQPKALLHGDSTDVNIRKEAKAAIGNGPFDAIIADPPYGIRESLSYSDKSPLEELFASIATDRKNEDRLLREGGRLVAFVAVTDEETLDEMLPNQDLTAAAGLEFEVSREQTLNDKLSRWLVSYVCRT